MNWTQLTMVNWLGNEVMDYCVRVRFSPFYIRFLERVLRAVEIGWEKKNWVAQLWRCLEWRCVQKKRKKKQVILHIIGGIVVTYSPRLRKVTNWLNWINPVSVKGRFFSFFAASKSNIGSYMSDQNLSS